MGDLIRVGNPGAGPVQQYEHTLGRAREPHWRDHTVSVGEGSPYNLSGRHFSGLIRQKAGIIICESPDLRPVRGIRGSIVAGKKTK